MVAYQKVLSHQNSASSTCKANAAVAACINVTRKTSVGSPRKKVCFDYFVHTLSITFLADCLGYQPGDEPGTEQSDHYSN